jgi:vitamin B12 transporter
LFDQQDIADTTATDLPGLLQLAPGAQISRTGGPGSTTSLYLRGASSTQSLLLIDGVRVDSVSLGAPQLAQIPLDQIDHVEVVNGNVSALYGSGAIGGVVQVFTKEGGDHPPRFNFSLGYGSYHTQTQQAGVNGALDKDGNTTFSISLARSKDDGFSSLNPREAPNANPNANGYLNESISASLRHKFNDKWDAGASYFQSNGNNSYDNAYGVPTDLNNLYSKVRQLSVFANGRLTDWWTTHFIVAEGDDRSVSNTNGVYNGRFDTDNRQYTWQNDFALAAQQKLQVGYEHLDQSLDSACGFGFRRLYGALRAQPDSGQRAARPVFRFRRSEQLLSRLWLRHHRPLEGDRKLFGFVSRAQLRRSVLSVQRQSVDPAGAQPFDRSRAAVRIECARRDAPDRIPDALRESD